MMGIGYGKKVVETEPYPTSNTAFDHIMNGIVVSPDGTTLYINSGSRTDHGEVHDVDGRYPKPKRSSSYCENTFYSI